MPITWLAARSALAAIRTVLFFTGAISTSAAATREA